MIFYQGLFYKMSHGTMEDVIVDFSESESEPEDETLKACCEESEMMILTNKKELATQTISNTEPYSKHHLFDLKLHPSTRKIFARKLEVFLDDHIENSLVSDSAVKKTVLCRKKRFKLLSTSSFEYDDSRFVDNYGTGFKRKPIPLHNPDVNQLSSAITPNQDITKILKSLKSLI